MACSKSDNALVPRDTNSMVNCITFNLLGVYGMPGHT